MIGSGNQGAEAKLAVATRRGASAILILSILVVGCSSSRLGKALNVGVGFAAGLDLGSTRVAIREGFKEANPIMGQNPYRQWILKAAGVGGVMGATFLLEERGHPVMAHLLRGAAIVVWSAAAWHNHRLVQGRK